MNPHKSTYIVEFDNLVNHIGPLLIRMTRVGLSVFLIIVYKLFIVSYLLIT